MDNRLGVQIMEKNQSSLCLIFLASVMLLAVTLLIVLPPIVSRHHYDIYNDITSDRQDNDNHLQHSVLGLGKNMQDQPTIKAADHSPTTTTVTTTTTTTTTTITSRTTATAGDGTVVVQTQYGTVRGISKDGIHIFHGVPYAQSPVGDLRWKPPQPPTSWSPQEYDATRVKPGCPQHCIWPVFCPSTTSEDCLYLEIYTPANPASGTSLFPVMVYIHGGSFRDASSTSPGLDATIFVARANVITVLMEYRLGALGFLVTGQEEGQATGNYGILDQKQAINWVVENIRAFGGDPEKVTLAGQSAGAQSVLIHMTSEDISRHFQGVIVESPPLTLRYKTVTEAADRGKQLVRDLQCVDDNDDIDMNCMREKTADDILTAQAHIVEAVKKYMDKYETWGPVMDDKVVTSQTMDSLRHYSKTRKPVKPMIWGHTSEEALIFVKEMLSTPVPSWMYSLSVPMLFSDAAVGIKKLYPSTNKTDAREDLSVLATDYLYRCPLRWAVQQLERSRSEQEVRLWSYLWDHSAGDHLPNGFTSCNGRMCHGVEIPFVFQSFSRIGLKPSSTDMQVSNMIIDYYTNFIMFGDPNGETRIRRAKRALRAKRRKSKDKSTRENSDSRESSSSKLPAWPMVNSGQSEESFTQIVFTRTGDVQKLKQHQDDRCDMWDNTGYTFSIK